MVIEMLASKIHRARVTDSNLDYEGSFTIDSDIMKKAGIIPYQAVEIYNVTNGSRLKTYAIEGEPGSRTFCANGAAAHQIKKGDVVIICAYVQVDASEAAGFRPTVLRIGDNNEIAG